MDVGEGNLHQITDESGERRAHRLESRRDGDCAVLHCRGMLDENSRDELLAGLNRLQTTPPPHVAIVDLTEVEFLEECAVDLIVSAYRSLEEIGAAVIVSVDGGQPEEMLRAHEESGSLDIGKAP